MVETTTVENVEPVESVEPTDCPVFYTSWAYTDKATVASEANSEALKWIEEHYKVWFKSPYRSDDMNFLVKSFGIDEANRIVRERAQKERDAEVLLEYVESGYGHIKYRVLRNIPNLSDGQLALICDKGNVCFGFRVAGDMIIIHTD